MLNNLVTHFSGKKKMQNLLKINYKAIISVKWFYIIVEIKLGFQYEPENLDVNKVCLAK